MHHPSLERPPFPSILYIQGGLANFVIECPRRRPEEMDQVRPSRKGRNRVEQRLRCDPHVTYENQCDKAMPYDKQFVTLRIRRAHDRRNRDSGTVRLVGASSHSGGAHRNQYSSSSNP
jgi:hypothetical protein